MVPGLPTQQDHAGLAPADLGGTPCAGLHIPWVLWVWVCAVPSWSDCGGAACAAAGAALACSSSTGITELSASSHECPWAESDLQTKRLWRVGIPEKGSSLCLGFLLSGVYFWTDYKHWRQLLPHLKIALEESLTVPWPAANCNCYY